MEQMDLLNKHLKRCHRNNWYTYILLVSVRFDMKYMKQLINFKEK